jgi:mono/diheme cytochrome c family protein
MATTIALCSAIAGADELFDKGKAVFIDQAQPSCAICHALKDAGAVGAIGPDFDDLKPTTEQVYNAVNGGIGIMPDFSETLSKEQMKAVAYYVSTAVGR